MAFIITRLVSGRGLGQAAQPPGVIADAGRNQVIVGDRTSASQPENRTVQRVNWVSIAGTSSSRSIALSPPSGSDGASPGNPVKLVLMNRSQHHCCPAVWYDGDIVLGGGILKETKKRRKQGDSSLALSLSWLSDQTLAIKASLVFGARGSLKADKLVHSLKRSKAKKGLSLSHYREGIAPTVFSWLIALPRLNKDKTLDQADFLLASPTSTSRAIDLEMIAIGGFSLPAFMEQSDYDEWQIAVWLTVCPGRFHYARGRSDRFLGRRQLDTPR